MRRGLKNPNLELLGSIDNQSKDTTAFQKIQECSDIINSEVRVMNIINNSISMIIVVCNYYLLSSFTLLMYILNY